MIDGGLRLARIRTVTAGLCCLALAAAVSAMGGAATAQQQPPADAGRVPVLAGPGDVRTAAPGGQPASSLGQEGTVQDTPTLTVFRMPERTSAELADWLAVAAARLRLPPITRLEADGVSGDRFAIVYQRLRAFAEEGWTEALSDGRYELVGAAYFDRGSKSLSLLDAHLLAAHALLAEGDWAAADRHLAAGHDILAEDDFADQMPPAVPVTLADAWIAHRLMLVECASILAATGEAALGTADFGRLNESLAEILQRAEAVGDTESLLADEILATLAVLHVAAGQQPQDERIRAAVATAFGG